MMNNTYLKKNRLYNKPYQFLNKQEYQRIIKNSPTKADFSSIVKSLYFTDFPFIKSFNFYIDKTIELYNSLGIDLEMTKSDIDLYEFYLYEDILKYTGSVVYEFLIQLSPSTFKEKIEKLINFKDSIQKESNVN